MSISTVLRNYKRGSLNNYPKTKEKFECALNNSSGPILPALDILYQTFVDHDMQVFDIDGWDIIEMKYIRVMTYVNDRACIESIETKYKKLLEIRRSLVDMTFCGTVPSKDLLALFDQEKQVISSMFDNLDIIL